MNFRPPARVREKKHVGAPVRSHAETDKAVANSRRPYLMPLLRTDGAQRLHAQSHPPSLALGSEPTAHRDGETPQTPREHKTAAAGLSRRTFSESATPAAYPHYREFPGRSDRHYKSISFAVNTRGAPVVSDPFAMKFSLNDRRAALLGRSAEHDRSDVLLRLGLANGWVATRDGPRISFRRPASERLVNTYQTQQLCRFLGLGLLLGAVAGCGLDIADSILVSPTAEQPMSDSVTVVFRNRTEADAVDVQFHASNAVLANVSSELFVDANKVVSSIGVAGTGIIEPGEADVISLPCADDLSIGTSGGRFLDNETGAVRGQGVARWVQERPLDLCGAVVRVDFSENGASFETSIRILDLADIRLPSSP